MAREGLRTLVVAKKNLSEEAYSDFEVGVKTFFWYCCYLGSCRAMQDYI